MTHVRADKMSKPTLAHMCMKIFDTHRMCMCWFWHFICEINLFVLTAIQTEQKRATGWLVHFRKKKKKCAGKTVNGWSFQSAEEMQQVVWDFVLPSGYRILREACPSDGVYYVSVLSGEFMIDMCAEWGDWKRLQNEELNDLYSSPNIVGVRRRGV